MPRQSIFLNQYLFAYIYNLVFIFLKVTARICLNEGLVCWEWADGKIQKAIIIYTYQLISISQSIINKMSRIFYPFLILLILSPILASTQNKSSDIVGKVVEIQPVALDVIVPIYDRVVVFFTHGINSAHLQLYQSTVQQITKNYQGFNPNKTLFAICDLDKDLSGKLNKYGQKSSIKIINSITQYGLQFPHEQSQIKQFFENSFVNFIKSHTSSKLYISSLSDLKSQQKYKDRHILWISTADQKQQYKTKKIQQKIFDYLNFFNVSLVLNSAPAQLKVELIKNGQLLIEYPHSAVVALFNFSQSQTGNQPNKQEINDLIDFINVETIDDVTFLDQANYFRVFGSNVDYQILLAYQQKHRQSEQINKITKQFAKAANRNRNEGLKYQRVLFAVGTEEFLNNYFADSILQNNEDIFTIVVTKTDFSSFQLRKFVYESKEVSSEKLLAFIQDIKMKKIDASYKSEKILDNQDRRIRKIVGHNFQKQIFEQSQKSVMVLFIDSKDKNSSQSALKLLEQFVEKYHDAYKQNMHVGTFDLAKNEHRSLTISTAPQFVLFEKTNKKKSKFFRGKLSLEHIKNWVNYQVKDVTIPENFGQPPIAIGGSASTSTQL